jgi:hypothetical protein
VEVQQFSTGLANRTGHSVAFYAVSCVERHEHK